METKNVYRYDEKNHFEHKIVLDDTDRSPSGSWNIPSYCTEVEPPTAKDGFKIKWNGSNWEYEKESEEPEPPKPTLDELKERKLNEVNYWTAQKITGGFTSSASGQPVTYDSDKDTQLTMQGICINVNTPLFAEKYPNGCPVRGYAAGKETKDVFMLNANQVLQWQADLSIHIGTCKQEGWLKQAEVESCNTEAELKKIVLD